MGVLAVLASIAIAPSANAGETWTQLNSARANADQPSAGHLCWRPYRPVHAPQNPEELGATGIPSADRNGGTTPAKPVATAFTSHDEPLSGSTETVHLSSNVVPVQYLAPADPLANPFNDEPAGGKSAKTDSNSPARPTPGPATAAPTLPEPISPAATPPKSNPVAPGAPAKLPDSDPFRSDVPKAGGDPGASGSPLPAPAAPGNGTSSQPKGPAVGPAEIIPPMQDVDMTTSKARCDKELADLIQNTVDKVQLDIRPKIGPTEQLPGECTLGDAKFVARDWPCITYTWKASALCHKPLYFEEVALERYGHSRGPIVDPLVSAAHFFVCVPLLPYEMGVEPPCECEYSLGYYRPGSCAPWIIDGFPISLRGMALECTVATGAAFAIP